MKRSAKVWIFSALTALVFLVLGLYVPRWIGLEATEKWVLRGGVWFLGVVATILVFIWASSKWKKQAKQDTDEGDEIDVTISAARKRLAEARGKAAARFGKMPVILVLGPVGSAKTTIITRSGMEPELLAGEVLRGDSVMPTSAVNVWYAQDNLVFEAGGPIAGDASRWKRLIRHIQPNRLAAAFSRGRQAPRVAVVCFGCDELLKPGASQSVPATAQKLRARLAEVSEKIGIRLPVYVLFTKTDRLPYFEEYMRSMTRDEARDVLGATLTVPPPDAAVGVYAEREARRLSEAFNVLFRGLALRRIDLLPREAQDDVKAGVYEFPREFRKVADLATQFLLDLCRPSQLGVSPFLRGFYFTGVRAVYVHDVGAETAAPASQSSQQSMDATGVFDPRMLQQQQRAAPAQAPGSRKIPEWTFLERVFRDVVLRDGIARGVTGGGTRVNFMRRTLIATGAIAGFILTLGFTWSFFANRGLMADTRDAVQRAEVLSATGPLPEPDAFDRLDALRTQAERLDRYSREGAPLGLSWLLYSGNRYQAGVRQLYFTKFGALQWQRTRENLIRFLNSPPDSTTATSAFDDTYEALRTYIATTTTPDSARREQISPTMLAFWNLGIDADSIRTALASRQFDFFADELPWGNPYDGNADMALIDKTRRFLRSFAGADQLYRVLITQAADSAPPIRWAGSIVRNDVVVPGQFTRRGWDNAQAILSDVPRLFDRETWVLGEGGGIPEGDRTQLAQQLRERYAADFIDTWQRFLAAGSVARFANARDASTKLADLSTNDSQLLRMLGIVADNTAVDTTLVGVAFRPVLDMVPPNATTVTETAGGYLNTLVELKGAFDAVDGATGPMQNQALADANSSVQRVKSQVGTLARGFSTEGEARETGVAVSLLLQMPAQAAEGVISDAPATAMNAKGASFCAPFRQFANLYPFNPASATDAAVQDVINALARPAGGLWQFYQSELTGVIVPQGNNFVAAPGSALQLNPGFVSFFSRAAQVSNAMFDANGGLQVLFTLRIETSFDVPEVTVTLAGRPQTYTQSQPSGPPLEWNGSSTGARIQARVGNADVTVVEVPAGPWAPFRLFQQGEMVPRGGGRASVSWRVPGQTASITGEVSFAGGVPVFQSGYLTPLGQCVTRIVR